MPGVTAALAGAAVLGAPLMHDFTVLSLSDLLTPWEVIRRRLELAAQGDFVLCLYNPSSRRRRDHLRMACDIVLAHRAVSYTHLEVLTPELLREIYEVEAEVARDSRGCLRIFFQPIRNEGEESI